MQLKTLNSVTAIFDVLGGSLAVQELTGDKPTTVSNWRNWNVCPANTHDLFLRELAVRGYWAPPALFAQRERNRKKPRKKKPRSVTTHRQAVHKSGGNGRGKGPKHPPRQKLAERADRTAEEPVSAELVTTADR